MKQVIKLRNENWDNFTMRLNLNEDLEFYRNEINRKMTEQGISLETVKEMMKGN